MAASFFMNDFMNDDELSLVPASRGRILLAIYLDLIIFNVPWAFLHFFILRSSPDLERLSTPAKFVAFAVLEFLLHRFVRWSPGEWLLAIRTYEFREAGQPLEAGVRNRVRFVDAETKLRESWLTILAAVLVLLEGTKGLVRWTMWAPPTPMFGSTVPAEAWPIVAMSAGAIECLIAYLLFRTQPMVMSIGIPYFATMLVSVVTSWTLWESWVAESVTRRRAYQGVPIRPGEIEQAQAITPEILVAGPLLYLVLVVAAGAVLVYRRRRTEAVAASV